MNNHDYYNENHHLSAEIAQSLSCHLFRSMLLVLCIVIAVNAIWYLMPSLFCDCVSRNMA
jgi:hypothetical protein